MAKKTNLPDSYIRLKKYALLVEEICKDIELRGYGYDPGVLFASPNNRELDLPEWFLERLYKHIMGEPEA
jgi:hypothetical protein